MTIIRRTPQLPETSGKTEQSSAKFVTPGIHTFLRRAAFLLLATLGTLQCTDPGPEALTFAAVDVVPVFDIQGARVVPVAQARLRILRSDSSTVVIDTVVAIQADSVIELSVQVVLRTDPEQFIVSLEIIGPQGTVVFRGGPRRVTVRAQSVPIELQIRYTGPGFNATGVRITTVNPEVAPGGTVSLAAEAYDAQDAQIAGTPILWTSLDPALATVPALEVGQVVAGPTEGTARLEARLLTGQADTITVQIRQQVPEITLTPDTLFFQAAAGGTNPLPRIAQITNTGTPLSVLSGLAIGAITYDQGSGWINGWTLPTGTAPTALSIFVSIGGLTPGSYTAHVPVTAPTATNSPRDLVVVLNVTGATSVVVTPAATAFTSLGDAAQLTATALDAQGNPVPNQTFTWTSSATNVATVDATGRVTAVGNGPATITASTGTLQGTATVSVSQVVASVVVMPNVLTFSALGQTSTLSAGARDANNNPIAGRSFSWSSDQPTIASVNVSTGLVTALANTLTGPVTITATTGGISGTASVTTNQNATQISVAPTTASLNPGQTVALTATVLDANDQPATGVVVAWTSSGLAASVVSTGPTTALVTGSLTQVGAATITATFGALNATSAVTVVGPASVSVATDPVGASTNLTSFGDSLFLTAAALDVAGAPIAGLTFAWQVSNPAAASIAPLGPARAVVVALGNGSFVVTASTVGAVSGTLAGNVSQVATTINVTPALFTLNALGKTTQLTAVATDARGNPVPVAWLSGNPGAATVNAAGLVTATSNGTAVITATAGALQASSTITVQQVTAIVLVTPPTATTNTIGDSVFLTASARDPLGNVVAGATATWLSSAPTKASVTSTSSTTAKVTALAVSPGVTITATMGPASGVSTVVIGQVVNAPLSTAIVPATGAAGLPSDIVIQGRDAAGAALSMGGANVQVTIAGANPSGPTAAVDSLNGRYGFRYSPVNLGTDIVAITLNGIPISGSPFASVVSPGPVDANASGTVVPAGAAGTITSLVITGRDQFGHAVGAGGATIGASFRVGSVNAALPLTITDSAGAGGTAGVYTVAYTPTVSGLDSINATLNGAPLFGSPFAITVAAGTVNATTSTASVPSSVTSGIPSAIVVQGRDAAGNPVSTGGATVSATVASGPNVGETFVTADSAALGGTPGVYTLTYTPLVAGVDFINVTLNGSPVAGTQPFSVTVTSGGVSGVTSTAQFTPDVTTPGTVIAGTPVLLRVQGKDGNSNNVTTGGATVVMNFFSGPNKPAPPTPNPLGAVDNGNGTYDYFYTPTVATPVGISGVDSIAVTLNGIPIAGSPFGAHVIPAAIDPTKTTVTVSDDYTTAPVDAGTPITFTVTTRDQYDNALRSGGATIAASVSGTNGPLDLSAGAVDNGDGTYTVQYMPTIVGTDNVSISVNGVTVQGAPFTGTITPSYADFATSTATLTPGTTLVAGTPASVTVTAFDAYGNSTTIGTVQVSGTGANAFSPVAATNNGNGTFTFNFPTSSGGPETSTTTPDQIVVQMDGGAGPGSIGPVSGTPFALTVLPGPISGIHSVPTFVPNVTAGSIVAGTQVNVTIQGKDAFGNNIDITTVPAPDRVFRFDVIGPNSFEGSIPAIDNNDGTWSTSYTPFSTGTDILDIRHKGTVGVAGNPFNAQVIPSTIAGQTSTVTFTPSIASPIPAGTPLTLTIQGRDQYGNNVDINTVPGPARVFVVTITEGQQGVSFNATDNNDGTWTASYTPTISGTTSFSVLHQGTTGGPGNPYSVNVTPLAPVQLQFLTQPITTPFGYALNPTPIGVAAVDVYGNVTPSFNETVVLRVAPGTGNPQAFLFGQTSAVPINGLATFSNLYLSSPGTAFEFEALTTSFTQRSDPFNITALGYVVSRSTNSVAVFDAITNENVGSPIPVGLTPTALAKSPGGDYIYVTNSGSNDVSVISTVSNMVVATVPVGNKPVDIAVAPDDKYFYVVNADDNAVSVFAVASLNQVASVPVGNSPSAIAVTPDGTLSYVSNTLDGTVTVINNTGFVPLGSPISVGPGATGGGPTDVGVSLDGLQAYAVNRGDGNLYTIDTSTNGLPIDTVSYWQTPARIAVVPVDPYQSFSDVYVTDESTGFITGTCDCYNFTIGGPDVLGITSDPQGGVLFVTSPLNNTVYLFDTQQGSQITTFPVPDPVDVVINYVVFPLS